MNAKDILMYGNGTVLQALEGVPDSQWETPDVCGRWSVKNIVAHLASFELVLLDVLANFVDGSPTPNLDRMGQLGGGGFNDYEVDEVRRDHTRQQVFDEYNQAHARTMDLIARIPVETRTAAGSLPWYGAEYALDDFIVYQYYGHKREHMSQVGVFIDLLKSRGLL